MSELVLVLNAGSSSLKYQVVAPGTGETVVRGLVERVDESGRGGALDSVLEAVRGAGVERDELAGVGHRVVHGGDRFAEAVLIDDDVVDTIDELAVLAPLHNPPALGGIRLAREAFPHAPQVAVFDTAWFAGLPAAATTYALDRDVMEREGIRRYGFHGISHQYVAGEAARFLGRPPEELAMVVLHVGNGASATAVLEGGPVETSMGLTPLEGLVMGTRGGDVDPGVLLHLLHRGYSVEDLEDLLNHRSGLQGLAGMNDLRDLHAARARGDERATSAYEVYCHRLRKYVGAYAAVLGRLDAVVFTAGVGERDPDVRADSLSGLGLLGIEVDPERNSADANGARVVSTDTSPVPVLVVPTNEELSIARQVSALVAS
ncbi:acetate kinase [Nocardioides sp.]|uniref:acetate kinase n=1 Tax=Nocardioides sp. TaxID=35761 RepID=UPI001A2D3B02|nr:acetate kinase [Nocardioides sp.]MBJ7356276.1 acetate kinase [Nocardioides sp.]